MRIFEILLILIIFCTLLLRFFRFEKAAWIHLFPLTTLLVLGYHLYFEGFRWQMIPLYLLALALLPDAFRQTTNPQHTPQKKWSFIAFGLLAVFSLPPILLPVPVFPQPTGPYAVGTQTFYWVDSSRLEVYSPNDDQVYADPPNQPRKVMVQVWYPSVSGNTTDYAPYLPDGKIDAQALSSDFGFPSFFLNHVALAKTNAVQNNILAQCFESWPVLIFSHGWDGMRYQNTVQMETLASHGYVVFAPEHAYGAVISVYPDGSKIYNKPQALPKGVSDEEYQQAATILGKSWVGDLIFTLDQIDRLQSGELKSIFTGHLDTTRIGLFGHSTGGGAVFETCWLDERCKAVLGEDPWLLPYDRAIPENGIQQPALMMFSEAWQNKKNLPLVEMLWQNQPAGAARMTILGTQHYDFADMPLYSPIASTIGLKGPIDTRREISLLNDFLVGFFDKALLDSASTKLNQAQLTYPEVEFEQK